MFSSLSDNIFDLSDSLPPSPPQTPTHGKSHQTIHFKASVEPHAQSPVHNQYCKFHKQTQQDASNTPTSNNLGPNAIQNFDYTLNLDRETPLSSKKDAKSNQSFLNGAGLSLEETRKESANCSTSPRITCKVQLIPRISLFTPPASNERNIPKIIKKAGSFLRHPSIHSSTRSSFRTVKKSSKDKNNCLSAHCLESEDFISRSSETIDFVSLNDSVQQCSEMKCQVMSTECKEIDCAVPPNSRVNYSLAASPEQESEEHDQYDTTGYRSWEESGHYSSLSFKPDSTDVRKLVTNLVHSINSSPDEEDDCSQVVTPLVTHTSQSTDWMHLRGLKQKPTLKEIIKKTPTSRVQTKESLGMSIMSNAIKKLESRSKIHQQATQELSPTRHYVVHTHHCIRSCKLDWRRSLSDLLRDPEGSNSFKHFLKREFSEENLEFWLEVQRLHQVQRDEQARIKIKAIYLKYFVQGACCELNLDLATKLATANRVIRQPKSRDVFDEAAHKIFILMERDSYSRFLKASHRY